MAVRRYEISLQVSKNISQVSTANERNIFGHKKVNFVSPSSHVYMNTNELPNRFTFHSERHNLYLCNHSNGDIFTCEAIML